MNRCTAMRIRDHNGLLRLRPVAVAAKTAAEMALVHIDAFFGDTRDLRCAKANFLRTLVSQPDIDAIVCNKHRGVAGLHSSTRQIRRRVSSFDNFGSTSKSIVDIALIDSNSAGLAD